MRDYGKLATRFWSDRRVIGLSDHAKLVFIYLLAGAETNCIGCFRVTTLHLAASEICDPEAAKCAIDDLVGVGLIQYDDDAKVVLLPHFLKYNPICNGSSGKAAIKAVLAVPDSHLLDTIIPQVVELLDGNIWTDSLPDGWRHKCLHRCKHKSGLPILSYPDQDQDPEGGIDTGVRKGTQGANTSAESGSPPELPTAKQTKTITEMAIERGVSLAGITHGLGIQRITAGDVTAVMDAIRANPRPDPEALATEERNVALRLLKAELEKIVGRTGLASASDWIGGQDPVYRFGLWDKLNDMVGQHGGTA